MRSVIGLAFIFALLSLAAPAQQAAIGFCALDQTLDFKTAKAGDKVALHLTRDLEINGKTLMPRGTAVSATIAEARDGTALSLVLEKAALKGGQEIPLMGIIAALAAPPADLTDDPFYSMNHMSEPTQRTGNAPQTSSASSGAAVQTAQLKGGNNVKSSLQADSSGVAGIDGLKLTWVLDKPPATTVLTAKKKNFKQSRGTEVLLRMAPPRM